MEDQLFAVVVIYNTSITDSVTCNNILKIRNHKINTIIVDNSTEENSNKLLCAKNGFVYLPMHGNAGLSKAYNRVLDYLSGEKGIVIWFDDDTNVTQDYFDKLVEAAQTHPEKEIFVPVIMGQDGKFWSPNKFRFFRNKQIKNPSETISDNDFNAINSCTASRLTVFSNYRYDERLFLDQVDHSFCRDQRKLHRHFYKLNCVIHHNFSTKNKMANIDAVKKRYRIMIPDFLNYCSIGKKDIALGYIKVIGWGIRESIKYKKMSFLPWCISQAYLWKSNQ